MTATKFLAAAAITAITGFATLPANAVSLITDGDFNMLFPRPAISPPTPRPRPSGPAIPGK